MCSEIFEKHYKEAEQIIKTLTLEQKIGQLFLARYEANKTDKFVNELNVGGFVLFGADFNNKTEDIKSNLKRLEELSASKTSLKLAYAVDEEGGTVCRISSHKDKRETRFPSPQNLYNEGGLEKIKEINKEKIELLRKHYININLAPVADFARSNKSYIYNRTLGQPLETTCDYIKSDTSVYVGLNFSSCAKHFPGYADAKDTHIGPYVDNRTIEEFENIDFKPFIAGIKSNITMILVNHNIVPCLDSKHPCSLSEAWHKKLRSLNFSGLILTDDLAMGAIKNYTGEYPVSILAVLAENNYILTSSFEEHFNEVLNATKKGILEEKKIDEIIKKNIAWKIMYLGLGKKKRR